MGVATYEGTAVLVTGASMGLGAEFARQLAARRVARLVLTARSEGRLQQLAEELRGGELGDGERLQVDVIPLDLTAPGAPETLHAAVADLGIEVDVLVNNAGFGKWGPFEARDLATARSMMCLNCEAVVALTHLFGSDMLGRGRGGVLNVSSLASFFSLPYITLYAATKAFVTAFSEGLWGEWQARGVAVTSLCPGGTESEFHSTSETYAEERSFVPAPPVVRKGLDALLAGRPTVFGSLKHTLQSRAPTLMTRRAAAKVMERQLRPPEGWVPGE